MVALNQMSVPSSGNLMLPPQPVVNSHTVKRRKKSTAAPNPKKMFEEAQMVRRVKAYLNNMKVTTDEDELHRLSLECEQQGGSTPNNVQVRKRYPSPTLSTTSSTSSTSEGKKGALGIGMSSLSIGSSGSGNSGAPKFGAASPQAVKKLLSLSEQTKTRPHQPRHPSVGSVLPPPLNNIHHHSQIVHNNLSHYHHAHHTPYHHHAGISISPSHAAAAAAAASASQCCGSGAGPPPSAHPNPSPYPNTHPSYAVSSGIHLSNMPPNYNATMSMYPNGRPSVVMSSRILESSVDSSPSQLPPPMELPPESSSFRSPPNYAQAAHRRITGNSTSVLSSFPAPHQQNFGSSSRIIAAVGISPITPGYVPPGVNAISPMYQPVNSSSSSTSSSSVNSSNLPPAIPARTMHDPHAVDVIQQQAPPPQQPPPPLPPSLDLSVESSSVTVLSNAAPVL